MIKIFGLEGALMLCELYAEYRYWESKNKLTKDGFFFSTVENVENSTGLSKRKQGDAVSKLVEYGIIKKTTRGMPSKRHFKFQETAIPKLSKDIKNELKKEKERLKERYDAYEEAQSQVQFGYS